jgi:hypothetical protein
MSKVANLNRTAKKATPTFFSRWELQQLLNLYSEQVANGDWRDYAIDQTNGMVIFSVFRHTMEQPLYAVAKRDQGSEYIVYSGHEKVKRARSLQDALAVLRKRAQMRAIT